MAAPAYVPALVLGMSVVMITLTLFGLSRALVRAAWPERTRVWVVRAAAVLLIGWFAVALALALVGAYEGVGDRPPTIQFGILTPIVIAAVLIWRSDTVARIIDAVPQHWLIGVQVTRALGGLFLLLYVSGLIPGLFAVPAGVGDLATAGLAPVAAYAAARDPHGSARTVLAWNVLGLADFVVAVATGFATGPSPLQLAAFDNPNTLIATFPLVLIPVYLVPLWTILHIASLVKLRRQPAQSRQSAVPGHA
ncbi:MAG: hypothetical protein J2P50_03995 [Hyphomicrobiaceae bacterium]|nr:hypothetical protein [Hyphomicrobiaceae bacterium]